MCCGVGCALLFVGGPRRHGRVRLDIFSMVGTRPRSCTRVGLRCWHGGGDDDKFYDDEVCNGNDTGGGDDGGDDVFSSLAFSESSALTSQSPYI